MTKRPWPMPEWFEVRIRKNDGRWYRAYTTPSEARAYSLRQEQRARGYESDVIGCTVLGNE